jgi:hypothetical protein
MQRERHKWAIPTRLIVSKFIRMTDVVVVVMIPIAIGSNERGAKDDRHTVSII